jgi:hypothetical protein
MHKKSTVLFAFVLMAALVLTALSWGALNHWSAQREQVDQTLGTLSDMLTTRREVIANILTVAARHLPKDDALIAEVEKDKDLLAGTQSLPLKAEANERLSQNARELLAKLAKTPSVVSDVRDSMYVNQMLPQALEQSASMVQEAAYNNQAESFNRQISESFSGSLAKFLGVKPAQQFLPMQPQEVKP